MRIFTSKIRFHYWTTAVLFLFVMLLTGSILLTIFGRFEQMAEDNAKAIFSQMTNRSATEFQRLIGDAGDFLRIQTDVDADDSDAALTQRFIAALKVKPSIYSYYVGRPNGDFLQVIGVRGDAHIARAIGALPDTEYAVRTIVAGVAGRTETWRFLSATRTRIGELKKAATYDPRTRDWYGGALRARSLDVSDPYLFQSNGELGLSVASPLRSGAGVMGADVVLRSLNAFLASVSESADGGIFVLDRRNRLIGMHTDERHRIGVLAPLTAVAQSGNPFLQELEYWTGTTDRDGRQIRMVGGEKYVYSQHAFSATPEVQFRVAAFAPMDTFAAPLVAARNRILLSSLLMLLLVLPLTAFGARHISVALRTLARDSERVRKLDFSEQPPVRSLFHEVDALGRAHQVMKQSIQNRTEALKVSQDRLHSLVEIGMLLSSEHDRTKLLRHILSGGTRLSNCEAGTLYLVTEQNTLRFALRTMDDQIPSFELPLHDADTGMPNERYVSTFVATRNQTVVIDDVYNETRFDVSGTQKFDQESAHRTVSMLTVPIAPREGQVIGVLQFLNATNPDTGEIVPFSAGVVELVEALASQAAIALDNQQLVEAQIVLLDGVIRIIAGAIDAKSTYTGGHCERVPELAFMLAEEACRATEGPLASFNFNNADEWREFRIGAWLHDCGKVTTPEYVVDKATKMETIYNRIHEVRTRFEVLLRDAEIARLEAIVSGSNADVAMQTYLERRTQLLDDFKFVADCNVGGEFMAPERMARIRSIASQTWLRNFDDRLGLSHDELKRVAETPARALPALENLLADKQEHIVPRTSAMLPEARFEFKVNVPQHLYNFGEVYNLCIARGTLTEEERFKINDHIIQTIVMLDKLPFPKHLRRVPEYAGTHHETMIGTGYPRKLSKDDLSVPSRIMAVADIFEALTASDRPYKQAKTLSESIKILSRFRDDQHIDGDVFDLFLRSGVYLRYARRYLKPEQIDQVDIAQYLGAQTV